jgi:hypothetical protein
MSDPGREDGGEGRREVQHPGARVRPMGRQKMALDLACRVFGVSRRTFWNWRHAEKVQITTIGGAAYVELDDVRKHMGEDVYRFKMRGVDYKDGDWKEL